MGLFDSTREGAKQDRDDIVSWASSTGGIIVLGGLTLTFVVFLVINAVTGAPA